MNFNFQQARNLMVKNQLRPNKIKEKVILQIFKEIPKENFVPENFKLICYLDKDLNLLKKRGYLKNLHLAQIINSAEIKKTDNVLHIGGLTGYLSSIIAKLCNKLIVIEEDENILLELHNNIKINDYENIEIIESNLNDGYSLHAPYDLVIIDCPMHNLKKKLIEQINPDHGRIIYIEKIKDDLSKAYRLTLTKNSITKEYLFDVFSNFSIDKTKNTFEF